MLSVQTTNWVGERGVRFIFETASSSLGTLLMNGPIGPLEGAVYGAVRNISGVMLEAIANKCLNLEDPQTNTAAKTFSAAIKFFCSHLIAWAVLASAGFSLSVFEICVLYASALISMIPVSMVMSCLTPHVPVHEL